MAKITDHSSSSPQALPLSPIVQVEDCGCPPSPSPKGSPAGSLVVWPLGVELESQRAEDLEGGTGCAQSSGTRHPGNPSSVGGQRQTGLSWHLQVLWLRKEPENWGDGYLLETLSRPPEKPQALILGSWSCLPGTLTQAGLASRRLHCSFPAASVSQGRGRGGLRSSRGPARE